MKIVGLESSNMQEQENFVDFLQEVSDKYGNYLEHNKKMIDNILNLPVPWQIIKNVLVFRLIISNDNNEKEAIKNAYICLADFFINPDTEGLDEKLVSISIDSKNEEVIAILDKMEEHSKLHKEVLRYQKELLKEIDNPSEFNLSYKPFSKEKLMENLYFSMRHYQKFNKYPNIIGACYGDISLENENILNALNANEPYDEYRDLSTEDKELWKQELLFFDF